ncbi:MAG: DsbA family protein [Anaerolineales bacterium]
MNVEKKSKRQLRREQVQKKQSRGKLTTIILITLGAAFVLYAILAPQLRPAGEIIAITPRADLPNPVGLTLGDPNAPVTVDVYEDFQCPACRNFTETIEPLIIEHLIKPGKVKLVFHHFPFIDGDGASRGGESDQAANAAMCANDQDKFWDMNAIIFANWNGENKGNLSNVRLKAMAESIGLDMNKFNDCFNDNAHKDEIEADYQNGKAIGVQGTPSVFVNGEKVGQPGLIPQYQEIAEAVEIALSKLPQ